MSKPKKEKKPKPPFKMTAARQRILTALEAGARIVVTNDSPTRMVSLRVAPSPILLYDSRTD